MRNIQRANLYINKTIKYYRGVVGRKWDEKNMENYWIFGVILLPLLSFMGEICQFPNARSKRFN